jgi:hypothetical protein
MSFPFENTARELLDSTRARLKTEQERAALICRSRVSTAPLDLILAYKYTRCHPSPPDLMLVDGPADREEICTSRVSPVQIRDNETLTHPQCHSHSSARTWWRRAIVVRIDFILCVDNDRFSQ